MVEWLKRLLSDDVEWAKLAVDIIAGFGATAVALATAAWAILTYASQRRKDRQQREAEDRARRARHAALYVVPFLEACDELQSRLFNILDPGKNGLPTIKGQYPDGTYADELVYLIVRYFGWSRAVRRYGPYAFDQDVIVTTNVIADMFASDQRYPGVAFRFFRPQQRALGELVMMRAAGEFGVEFATMPFYDFQSRLRGWQSAVKPGNEGREPMALPLADVRSLQDARSALLTAPNGASLDGRDRLAGIQTELVKLVDYLERKECISLAPKPRKRLSDTLRGAPATVTRS